MKLPLPTSRKYKILASFLQRRLTLDDLIAEVGSFGTSRNIVRENLWELAREGFLDYDPDSGIYVMTARSHRLFNPIQNTATVAAPRTYEWKPLNLDRLHKADLRRQTGLDKTNERIYTVGPQVYTK